MTAGLADHVWTFAKFTSRYPLTESMVLIASPNQRAGSQGEIMAKVAPFHTNSTEYPPLNRTVYHDKDTCPDGKQIKPEHRESGMGAKALCKECEKVN